MARDEIERPRQSRPDATAAPLLSDRAIVSNYPAHDYVVRPSPVDDLDRFCVSAPLAQDGTSPFYGFVLADRAA